MGFPKGYIKMSIRRKSKEKIDKVKQKEGLLTLSDAIDFVCDTKLSKDKQDGKQTKDGMEKPK